MRPIVEMLHKRRASDYDTGDPPSTSSTSSPFDDWTFADLPLKFNAIPRPTLNLDTSTRLVTMYIDLHSVIMISLFRRFSHVRANASSLVSWTESLAEAGHDEAASTRLTGQWVSHFSLQTLASRMAWMMYAFDLRRGLQSGGQRHDRR